MKKLIILVLKIICFSIKINCISNNVQNTDMAKILKIPTVSNSSGKLSIIEKFLNFKFARVYYVYNFKKNLIRGSHKHKKNRQFLVCLSGCLEVKIYNKRKNFFKSFNLSQPNYGLLLEPQDWHQYIAKKNNSILLVIASHTYQKKDYIYEK